MFTVDSCIDYSYNNKGIPKKGGANRMLHISMKTKNKTIWFEKTFRGQGSLTIILLVLALSLCLTVPSLTYSAQKKPKAPPKPKATPVQKEIIVNDANLLVHQKRRGRSRRKR